MHAARFSVSSRRRMTAHVARRTADVRTNEPAVKKISSTAIRSRCIDSPTRPPRPLKRPVRRSPIIGARDLRRVISASHADGCSSRSSHARTGAIHSRLARLSFSRTKRAVTSERSADPIERAQRRVEVRTAHAAIISRLRFAERGRAPARVPFDRSPGSPCVTVPLAVVRQAAYRGSTLANRSPSDTIEE